MNLLNMRGLNTLIKNHRFSNWIKREQPTFCTQEILIKQKDTNRLKLQQSEIYTKQTLMKASQSSHINIGQDRCQSKEINRNQKKPFLKIKRSTEKDIILLNVCTYNTALKHIKKMIEMKLQIDKYMIIYDYD